MTIVASGEISLGGNATVTRSVACELSLSGTAQICMNQTAVRSLAARTTAGSAICMNDFYGKSSGPSLGSVLCGGYYQGSISSPANYYLILAPNASGCAQCTWKTSNTSSGPFTTPAACNNGNGYFNTFTYLNTSDHGAGNFCATRSINGYSDWYLPSINEISTIFSNRATLPAGENWVMTTTCANDTCAYIWSSTEYYTQEAFSLRPAGGWARKKHYTRTVRAVRRQAF